MQDLWAELNNEQASPESAGQVQEPPRRRRLTEQVILSSLRDWLLHDYVAPYCRMLSATRIYRRCYWIDALGSIETRTNAKTEALSTANESGPRGRPVIPAALQPIVSLADVLAHESRPIALHGIVLEAGSSKRKEARATGDEQRGNNHVATSAKDVAILPKESGIVRASWLEIAPNMLNLIDQSPAIFLLNPFGHILFTYDDLAPLYQRTAPTELCLLVSHKQVVAHLTSTKGITTLTALLRSDRWKTLPVNDEEMERTIHKVIDLLIASMQRHFLSVQRIALPVQVRPAVVETAPYTLIFATRRQDSLASMNDAVCLHRRSLYEQSHRGVLAEEWFAAQHRERFAEEMQQLYQRILQQGRTQRVRRWPDLRQHLLNANFGHYTKHEYDEVMLQLLAHGDVRCEWRQRSVGADLSRPLARFIAPTEGEGEERRVPANDDALLWR